jgi:predicted short-subunit dehydrogenase-like oxidoreductase (DUF2520 family)
MTEGNRDVAIIGPGRVGTALGALFARRGGRIVAVGGRTRQKAEDAAGRIGNGARACDIYSAAQAAPNIILSVTDDAIAEVCAAISQARGLIPGAVLVHCSGALSSADLHGAVLPDAFELGSMHPLQTFPTVDAAIAKLPGAYCFHEGTDKANEFVTGFAQTVGMIPVPIRRERKVLYHASATMASNYLVALIDAAIRTGTLSGVDRQTFWRALKPLIEATLENVDTLGTTAALTGPIARGNIGTVQKHLGALQQECPDNSALYRELGLAAASIAFERKSISEDRYNAIVALLKGRGGGA